MVIFQFKIPQKFMFSIGFYSKNSKLEDHMKYLFGEKFNI